MSLQMRIALGTICVFNAFLFVVLGALALFFVDGGAAALLACGFWLGSGMLFGLARHLRRGTEWG